MTISALKQHITNLILHHLVSIQPLITELQLKLKKAIEKCIISWDRKVKAGPPSGLVDSLAHQLAQVGGKKLAVGDMLKSKGRRGIEGPSFPMALTETRNCPRRVPSFSLIWPKLGYIHVGPITCKEHKISTTAWMNHMDVGMRHMLCVGESGTHIRLQAGNSGS